MEDRTRVEWREWGDEAFSAAERTGKPILLSVTATWSTQCAEMDEQTYAEPHIAANVNDGFVPVRVDVDRHPRIGERYNMGGFPSTVFLTPSGEIVTGAGYLGPDGLRQVIDSVRQRWDADGASAGRVPRSVQDNPTPDGELTPEIEATLLARLQSTYDERAGGWGEEAKFPMARTVEFALKREREMALRTLNAISASLLDDYEGGFFRHARTADWSNPQYEKVLDTNGSLIRAFANAYCYTGREEYHEPAQRTIEYLTTTLWVDDVPGAGETTGAFAASQAPGAGVAYYTQDASDREAETSPPVDGTVIADWNALAIDGLLTFVAYTDEERARQFARRALQTLLSAFVEDGRTIHYRGARRTAEDHGEEPAESGERGLLVDHARTIAACCRARQVLGPDAVDEPLLGVASRLADHALDELRPGGGGFVDGPRTGPGLLDRPLRPLDGTVELADALLDLASLTGESRYRAAARSGLEAFAGAADRFGPQAAAYGSAVSRCLGDRLRIDVTTAAGSDLHRAALRVADHEKLVVPVPTHDAVRGGPDEFENGLAYVTLGDRIAEPASDPETLGERVQALLEE
jgi:uncharacterized protein YyaL (SSP411 family)